MSDNKRTPNDQRSDVKNPTSPERKANVDNRSVQLNDSKAKAPAAAPQPPKK